MATSASKQKRQALDRPSDTADQRLVEAALEIAERRATTLLRLHHARYYDRAIAPTTTSAN